jgi:hypothetical protein
MSGDAPAALDPKPDEGPSSAASSEAAGAGASASAAPKKPWPIEKRTLRGLGVALGVAAVVLLNYHVGRPWFWNHHIITFLNEDVATTVKAIIAFSALSLSVWALVRRLSGTPFPKKTITYVTILFGAIGVLGYISADDLGSQNFIHRWEFFHYYLGSKYPRELGYKRLYVCAAIAQAELGPAMRAEVVARNIRDLETDVIVPAAPVLDNPEACKSHFTPERWADFKSDVRWFRTTANKKFWEGMSTDHGYNPPPVWTMSGHFFGSLFPTVTNTSMTILASLDTIVFALTFFFVWWAFGLDTCCFALLFWGIQFPANGYFTGGAFLRQDWLLFLVLAACLLRKHYWALAGASLAMSSLLRVFPAIFFVGIAIVAITYLLKHKRFAKHHLRFFAGAAVASVVLVAASASVAGADSYPGFVRHIQLHHRTPLTNNMGLPVLLSFTAEGRAEHTRDAAALDEFGRWAEVHSASLEKRRPSYLAINAFLFGVLVLVVRKIKTLWVAMALSAVLVCSLPTLTCYYYTFFLVPALLSKASATTARMSLMAVGISAFIVTWGRVSYQWDDRFTTQSIVFLCFAFALLVGFMQEPKKENAPKKTPAARPA